MSKAIIDAFQQWMIENKIQSLYDTTDSFEKLKLKTRVALKRNKILGTETPEEAYDVFFAAQVFGNISELNLNTLMPLLKKAKFLLIWDEPTPTAQMWTQKLQRADFNRIHVFTIQEGQMTEVWSNNTPEIGPKERARMHATAEKERKSLDKERLRRIREQQELAEQRKKLEEAKKKVAKELEEQKTKLTKEFEQRKAELEKEFEEKARSLTVRKCLQCGKSKELLPNGLCTDCSKKGVEKTEKDISSKAKSKRKRARSRS